MRINLSNAVIWTFFQLLKKATPIHHVHRIVSIIQHDYKLNQVGMFFYNINNIRYGLELTNLLPVYSLTITRAYNILHCTTYNLLF